MPPVVTISASYGAGGSLIGPRVAELLGVPFVDRVIPTEVSHRGGLLPTLARLPVLIGAPPPDALIDDLSLKNRVEDAIRTHCADGAVVLGRAGAIVLAGDPRALHVRLDGPVDARVAQGAGLEGVDHAEAHKRLKESDRARTEYVQHFYRADPADPRHYHLVLDSTALDVGSCAELIAAAARARMKVSAPEA